MRIDAEIVPTAAGYLRAVSWGLPAICAFTVLRSFSEGVSQTKPVMWISLLALPANIAGNYVFMYGKLGCPALGAIGTGVATALVMWFEVASLAAYIATHRAYSRFGAFARFELPDGRELAGLLRLGVPMGASVFMEGSLFATVALLMGTMGTHVVAGHQVAINVASVTFMVPLGLAMAISVRVGQSVGAGNLAQARRAGLVGMALAVGFMSCMAILMWTLPHAIAALYTQDAEVHAIAVRLLAMAAVFQISDGLQVSSAFALRGMKDTRVTMLITFIAYWGLGLPLGYVLGITWQLGPQAMWIGLIAGLTVAAILLHTRFRRITRPV
jgi:MATE family multidrug resistance protein